MFRNKTLLCVSSSSLYVAHELSTHGLCVTTPSLFDGCIPVWQLRPRVSASSLCDGCIPVWRLHPCVAASFSVFQPALIHQSARTDPPVRPHWSTSQASLVHQSVQHWSTSPPAALIHQSARTDPSVSPHWSTSPPALIHQFALTDPPARPHRSTSQASLIHQPGLTDPPVRPHWSITGNSNSIHHRADCCECYTFILVTDVWSTSKYWSPADTCLF